MQTKCEGWWLIYFEDKSQVPEIFNDEMTARARLENLKLSWACHLFVMDTWQVNELLVVPSPCRQTFLDGTPHPKACLAVHHRYCCESLDEKGKRSHAPDCKGKSYCLICASEAKLRDDERTSWQTQQETIHRLNENIFQLGREAKTLRAELTALREGLHELVGQVIQARDGFGKWTYGESQSMREALEHATALLNPAAASGRQNES